MINRVEKTVMKVNAKKNPDEPLIKSDLTRDSRSKTVIGTGDRDVPVERVSVMYVKIF